MQHARLAVDIGGTFTDLALEHGTARTTLKVLTTPAEPERGVLEGVATILAQAGLTAPDIGILVHGTTLATNAIIERKGARTALITTEGFRDVLALGNESRYDQYDLGITLPQPLVPRHLRLPVPERLDNLGDTLLPLDENAVLGLVPILRHEAVESLAIGFLHSFVNPAHERRTRAILEAHLPGIPISLSSEISPEMREWERFSTTVANAYVQPLIAGYLGRLEAGLRAMGLAAPVFLMLSGGGLTTIETARRFPHPPGGIRPGGRRHLRRRHRAPMRPRPGAELRHGRQPPPRSASSTPTSRKPPAPSRSPESAASRRAPACRSASPSSRWSRSAPAAAAWPISTRSA